MTFIGANPDALRHAEGQCRSIADELGQVCRTVDSLLGAVPWRGQDARAFVHRWQGSGRQLVNVVAQDLSQMATMLRDNAAAQEQTSAVLEGGGVSAGTSGPHRAGASGAADAAAVINVPGALGRGRDEAWDRNSQTQRRDGGSVPSSKMPSGEGFTEGPPTRPPVKTDEDFPFGVAEPTMGDYATREKWRLAAIGVASAIGLDDGARMYLHYIGGSGEAVNYDLGEAYTEDEAVRNNTNFEMANAARGAERVATQDGTYQITGPLSPGQAQASTENWQKALGRYSQWSSATVTREGDQITMVVTVHAEDRYNFNRGASDIASGTPDDENGRLMEVGLARSFDTHGTYTRTVTWTAGSPPPPQAFN